MGAIEVRNRRGVMSAAVFSNEATDFAPPPRKRWRVRIDETVYGPYSTDHMLRFIEEGRIVAWSVVKPLFGGKWRHAGEDPILCRYIFPDEVDGPPAHRTASPVSSIGPSPNVQRRDVQPPDFKPPAAHVDLRPETEALSRPSGGQADTRAALVQRDPMEAVLVQALRDMLREPQIEFAAAPPEAVDDRAGPGPGDPAPQPHLQPDQPTPLTLDETLAPSLAQPLIRQTGPMPRPVRMTRLMVAVTLGDDADAHTLYDDAVRMLGETARIETGLWLLAARHTPAAVRNHLRQFAGQGHRIFVIDTLTSRSAWYNLTPEADRHVRLLLDGPSC